VASPDAGSVCTVGQDFTCNEDPSLAAINGQCVSGACVCNPGFIVSPETGKCRVDGICTAPTGLGWTLADGGLLTQTEGTCNGATCGIGCGCALIGQVPQCLCTGALPPDGGTMCIDPSCGVIHCACTCTDPATSTCNCP
jgi:hypothetical protein